MDNLNPLCVIGDPATGIMLENSIANHLTKYGNLQYYARRTGQEIDFILNEKIAFEVKETPGIHDLHTLGKRATQLGLNEYYLVG